MNYADAAYQNRLPYCIGDTLALWRIRRSTCHELNKKEIYKSSIKQFPITIFDVNSAAIAFKQAFRSQQRIVYVTDVTVYRLYMQRQVAAVCAVGCYKVIRLLSTSRARTACSLGLFCYWLAVAVLPVTHCCPSTILLYDTDKCVMSGLCDIPVVSSHMHAHT